MSLPPLGFDFVTSLVYPRKEGRGGGGELMEKTSKLSTVGAIKYQTNCFDLNPIRPGFYCLKDQYGSFMGLQDPSP